MKTKLLLSGSFAAIVLTVSAGGGSGSNSVSAVGSHAANNGGFSQPSISVSVGGTAANSTTADSTAAGAAATGDTSTDMGAGAPTPPDNTPPGTNAAPDAAQAPRVWVDTIVRTNSDGSVTNVNPHVNADGDVTNANGTMTYDTSKPRWWEKKD